MLLIVAAVLSATCGFLLLWLAIKDHVGILAVLLTVILFAAAVATWIYVYK